jgi:hypothetical protein
MPWIKKIKHSNIEKPHYCKVPGCSWGTKRLAVGSVWECNKCFARWKVVSVEQFSDGSNSKMTWSTGEKGVRDNYQKITRLSPILTDF